MAGIDIEIEGVDELVLKLGKTLSAEALAAPARRALESIQKRLQAYPPERPGQSYVRTNNLGRNWKINSRGDSLTNTTSYGPFVQGDPSVHPGKHQAWMHRDRWLTDQQAVDQETPAIQQDFADAIDSALQQ